MVTDRGFDGGAGNPRPDQVRVSSARWVYPWLGTHGLGGYDTRSRCTRLFPSFRLRGFNSLPFFKGLLEVDPPGAVSVDGRLLLFVTGQNDGHHFRVRYPVAGNARVPCLHRIQRRLGTLVLDRSLSHCRRGLGTGLLAHFRLRRLQAFARLDWLVKGHAPMSLNNGRCFFHARRIGHRNRRAFNPRTGNVFVAVLGQVKGRFRTFLLGSGFRHHGLTFLLAGFHLGHFHLVFFH